MKIPKRCVPENGTFFCYNVVNGDTMKEIGESFSVDDELLCEFNKISNCSRILAGLELKIPVMKNGKLPELKKSN